MKTIKRVSFILLILVAVIVSFVTGRFSTSSPAQAATTPSTRPTISQLLSDVNAERARNHVAPLTESAYLDGSAQYKASDMVARGYFDHADPSTGKFNGLDMADTMTDNAPMKCSYVSENLQQDAGSDMNFDAQQVVNSWISSPAHHAAMIDPKYSLTGFGIAYSSNTAYFVEHFCQTQ